MYKTITIALLILTSITARADWAGALSGGAAALQDIADQRIRQEQEIEYMRAREQAEIAREQRIEAMRMRAEERRAQPVRSTQEQISEFDRLLALTHPDWKQIVHSTEWETWKATLIPEDQALIANSNDVAALSEQFTFFKRWKARHAAHK